MPEYEIRLLAPAMQPTHSVYGAYSNDDEAVLVAKRSVVVKRRGSVCDRIPIFRPHADAWSGGQAF